MAKKTELKPNHNQLVARMAGLLSGTVDHIARMQAEIQDVGARCSIALVIGKQLPEFPEKDWAAIRDLETLCNDRFDDLVGFRKAVEMALTKVR